MNFILPILFTVIIPLKSLLAFTIVIDPGHGGADHGAVRGSIIESKIALSIAKKLVSKFENDSNTKIIYTRNSDNPISLKNRVKVSQQNEADLFISLHGNSSVDSRARGAEFYFGSSNSPQIDSSNDSSTQKIIRDLIYNSRLYQSQFFALDSFKIWKSSNGSPARSIRQAPFYVINKNNSPSILVEFGFITNPKESLELLKDEQQELIAKNLYTAIQEYREKK